MTRTAIVGTGFIARVHAVALRAIGVEVAAVCGRTVASASTMESAQRSGATATVDAATQVGKLVAERVKAAGITTVVFDRGGFKYHGRVAAVADGARAAGLQL